MKGVLNSMETLGCIAVVVVGREGMKTFEFARIYVHTCGGNGS